jgi:hypothetical protein
MRTFQPIKCLRLSKQNFITEEMTEKPKKDKKEKEKEIFTFTNETPKGEKKGNKKIKN